MLRFATSLFGSFAQTEPTPLVSQIKHKRTDLNVHEELAGSSPIDFLPLTSPVIASDLRIYNDKEYAKLEAFAKINCKPLTSPFARKKLIGKPFPFRYTLFQRYSEKPTLKRLAKLATCPITKRIMRNPIILHFRHKGFDFVTVCDNVSAQVLYESPQFKVIMKREWDSLKKTISFHHADLIRISNEKQKETKLYADLESWQMALDKINTLFPDSSPKDSLPLMIEFEGKRSTINHYNST